MAWLKRSSLLIAVLVLVLIMSIAIRGQAHSTFSSLSSKLPNQWSDAFDPPVRGTPDGRESGATRCSCFTQDTLIALVPTSGVGTTVAKYPTFFWYLPPTDPRFAKAIEFKLLDEKGQDIYATKFAVASDQQGFMSLQLPDSSAILPLEVGKQYLWQVMVICNPNQRMADPMFEAVEGSVVRVARSPSLPSQSNNAPLQEQLASYAKSRLWYETLTTLAELRRLHPNDPDLAAAWAKLLKSVDLERIAKKPMVVQSAASN